jgi:hypothetical protein
MSNTIKLKRGSGSDPSASDLVLGELAIRTDNGKIFLKKDNGSVAEVSGGGITDGDKGDITVSNSGGTFTIDNDVVSTAKMANMPTSRILGREASGTGDPQYLTATEARSVLNVENGATADQTASEIVALIADQTIAPSTIDMEDNEKIKIGTGNDLEIFHNATNSVIADVGNGNLSLQTNGTDINFWNSTDGEYIARFIRNGAVELYHDGNKKFETATYGSVTSGVHSVSNGILELKAAIATSHTITTDYNAIAVDPTINSGVTVTVPSGAVWAIV